MPVLRRPLLLMALLSLAAVACGGEDPPNPSADAGIVTDAGSGDAGQTDGSVPTQFAFVAMAPPFGSSDVAPNTSIAITFSTAVAQASATAETLLVFPASGDASAKVAGAISFPADPKTVVFKPQAALATGTQYKVLVKSGSSGLTAADGTALAADVHGTFTTSTELDTTRPTVSSSQPADNDVDVPLDTKITVRFSERIDPSSLDASAFEMIETWYGVPQEGDPVTGTWDTSANPTVVFTPAAWLEVMDEYTFTFKAGGVKDLAGNALAADYSVTFDAASYSPDQLPTVVSTSPAKGAVGVATNASFQVTFSERMRQSTITVIDPANVKIYPRGNPDAAVTLQRNTSANPTFLFYPQANLAPNTEYTLWIKGGADGVQDEAQTPMAESYTVLFTTGAGPDTSPLQVSAISPTTGATGVSQVTSVEVTFDKPVDPAKLFLSYPGTTGTFRVSTSADGSFPLAGTLDFSENPKVKFVIDPATTYELERTYYVRITGGEQGVRALSGSTMAADYSSSFTTMAPTEGTIEDLRAVDGVCAIRVRGVYATFFRDSSNDWSGFFAQKDGTGPGIYVVTGDKDYPPFGAIYPDTRADGYPNIDLTVTKVQTYEGFKQVVAWSWTRNNDATVELPWVKENLVQVIGDEAITEDHEAEYVQIDGTLGNYRPGTTQNRLYDLTWGTNRKVTLKVSDALKVEMGLANGTRVRVMAPVSQDKNGYFVRPNVFTTDQAMSAADLDLPENYEFLLDIVKLTP